MQSWEGALRTERFAEYDEGTRDTMPRAEWGDGPWQNEPDLVEWRAPAESGGYPLLIARNRLGALCGYVGLPPGHPLHGKRFEEGELADYELEAHDSISYSQACEPGGVICHAPLPGEPAEVWWLGFHCARAFDICPAQVAFFRSRGLPDMPPMPPPFEDAYRDLLYVRADVESLARQLYGLRAVTP